MNDITLTTHDMFSTLYALGLSFAGILVLVGVALLFSAYVKIATILAIVRAGFGFNSLPSAFVTGGLAVSLAFFVMYPTVQSSLESGANVLKAKGGQVNDSDRVQALTNAAEKWKEFLTKNADKKELEAFARLGERLAAGKSSPHAIADSQNVPPMSAVDVSHVDWNVAAPAFFVSELKRAFRTGLSLYLPFLVIELLTAAVLAAAGLEQVNPTYAALPLKLLLFVLVDGWSLITLNIAATYL